MSRRRLASASGSSQSSTSRNFSDSFSSQELSRNSQSSSFSQRNATSKKQSQKLQDMETQEELQLISKVIKYLLLADHNKHPIQKSHIIKNVLDGSFKKFNMIIQQVKAELSNVFGYQLLELESNKYILVNEISNHIPHLIFKKNINEQILLFLVLVHIFMLGESCKEDVLWDFLNNLGIVTDDKYYHEYFGNVKQLVTVEFVNQRYLEKVKLDKNNPTKFEYKWGFRAKKEISYRSALEFIANIYDQPLKRWKLQFEAVKQQETEDRTK